MRQMETPGGPSPDSGVTARSRTKLARDILPVCPILKFA